MKRTKTTNKGISIPPVLSIPKPEKKLPIPQEEIDMMCERKNEKLLFSFKFLDRDHKAFNLGGICVNWYITLLDTLKELSNLTRNELVVTQRQHYQAHEHRWNKLDYSYPFSPDFFEQVECLQFRLSKSQGRVHGFIIGNCFYIVWLDPHHNLYPDKKYGGRRFYKKPQTCFEILTQENIKLQSEIGELRRENEELYEKLTRPS